MSSGEVRLNETAAAKMLAAALKRASEEHGLSLRKLAHMLDYKQAVVLSHMSLGRVPIPIDRAEQLADLLGLNKAAFLRAVLEQRHPDVDWSVLTLAGDHNPHADQLAEELEAILGAPLSMLTDGQRRIIREVANDPRPDRRWATVQEIPTLELMREWRPSFRETGLSHEDRNKLKSMLVDSRH